MIWKTTKLLEWANLGRTWYFSTWKTLLKRSKKWLKIRQSRKTILLTLTQFSIKTPNQRSKLTLWEKSSTRGSGRISMERKTPLKIILCSSICKTLWTKVIFLLKRLVILQGLSKSCTTSFFISTVIASILKYLWTFITIARWSNSFSLLRMIRVESINKSKTHFLSFLEPWRKILISHK